MNRTPFSARGYPVRDRDGFEHWAVAIRASFAVRPDGSVAIAEDQEPVLLSPAYRDAGARELSTEADFAPFRPRADVIVGGVACAVDRAAVRVSDLRIRVGLIQKRARAFGRRMLRWAGGRHAIDGIEPFEGIRLTWRASLGGVDPFAEPGSPEAEPHPANPPGRGWTARWGRLPSGRELAMPLIEDPARPLSLVRPLPPPHGFGPVQPGWRPRLDHAGTYDEAWRRDRAPLPPADFSDAFHQAAPPDQVYPGTLRGGEPVEVEGMHPDGPYAFGLPQIVLHAQTRIGSDLVDSRPRLIGIALDGTAKTLAMTWNAHVPCDGRDHLVRGSLLSLRQMSGVSR